MDKITIFLVNQDKKLILVKKTQSNAAFITCTNIDHKGDSFKPIHSRLLEYVYIY